MRVKGSRVFVAIVFLAVALGSGFQNIQKVPPKKITRPPSAVIKVASMKITDVHCDHGGQPNPEVDIVGQNLGATRDNRRVLVDGVPATQYVFWSNSSATIQAPGGSPIKWYHEYTFVIDDGAGKPLSNEYKIRFPIDWDGASPGQAASGTEITLYCWGPGSSQGSKVLMMDGTVMQVTGWSGTGSAIQIKARVPVITSGPHKIFFMDGGQKISKDLAFSVL